MVVTGSRPSGGLARMSEDSWPGRRKPSVRAASLQSSGALEIAVVCGSNTGCCERMAIVAFASCGCLQLPWGSAVDQAQRRSGFLNQAGYGCEVVTGLTPSLDTVPRSVSWSRVSSSLSWIARTAIANSSTEQEVSQHARYTCSM